MKKTCPESMSTVYAFPTHPPSAPAVPTNTRSWMEAPPARRRGAVSTEFKDDCKKVCDTDAPRAVSVRNIGGTPLTPLVRADEMMALQAEANRAREAADARSSVAGMSLGAAVADARDALLGIPEDLMGNTPRKSLWDIFTHNDRMRGVGVLLVAVAASGLLIEAVFGVDGL